ncbi:unnamed protein product, partial [Brenthis ino]
MGGAVSSGRDNNELIDNLMSGNYIRSQRVEKVFRALDRADYMTPEARDQAYKDLAWRNGPLHMSSPCIYSEVMEGLELSPGLSFLNIGSGTGYLSTLAGLILGTSGISHGVEVHPAVVEYAVTKIGQFIENSPVLDDFDFCEPKFYHGNGLCLTPLTSGYDRVYCGAGCPAEYQNYFKRLIKVGGILVMPLNDTLLQIRRVEDNKWTSRSLLNVSFATLRLPSREEAAVHVKLDDQTPVRLQLLSRAVIRCAMRKGVIRRNPELREAPRAAPPAACPRRICIPIEPGGAVEGLSVLHDLDSENGANEMNALLSLVISMGHNRVADALRFDRVDSPSDSSDEENDNNDESEQQEDQEQPDDPEQPEQPEQSERSEQSEQPDHTDNNNQQEPRPNQDTDNNQPRPKQDTKRSQDTNSDSDDPRPPRPRVKRPDSRFKSSKSDKQRRHRRPRSDDSDDPKLPRGCRELLSYKDMDEPSTSSKGTQTSSGEYTDSSDQKSSEDRAKGSKGSNKSRSLPGMPSEVEIDLGTKIDQEASTSRMEVDWEGSKSDDDDDTEITKSKAKRQKLDSGIGETTPSNSSPEKCKSETESDNLESAEDYDEAATSEAEEEVEACVRAHLARRRRRVARGGDARRVRLSLLMKQAVRELPLPHALKKFVNLGRCFEF